MKKLVIFLSIVFILLFGLNYYQKQNETVECWWGVLYPSLSFIGFEDEQQESKQTMISSSNVNYVYIPKEEEPEPIKFRFAFKWLNKLFSL